MLHNVGMMPPDEMSLENVNAAYQLYRDRTPETTPESSQAHEFREKHHCQNPWVRFLGCFDTVGSLGIPRLPFFLGGMFGKYIQNRSFLKKIDFLNLNRCRTFSKKVSFS
jgi:uncharacterized protein (DUF2235 family)